MKQNEATTLATEAEKPVVEQELVFTFDYGITTTQLHEVLRRWEALATDFLTLQERPKATLATSRPVLNIDDVFKAAKIADRKYRKVGTEVRRYAGGFMRPPQLAKILCEVLSERDLARVEAAAETLRSR